VHARLQRSVICRPPIPLVAFANEAKPLQGDPREINRFDLDGQPVHRSGMSQNEFHETDVDA
jgi:hypothetical protein